MMKLFKISFIPASLLIYNGSNQVSAQQDDPCAQISMCSTTGTTMLIGEYPMEFLVCPWPDGSSICCVSCDDGDDDFKEGS